MRVIPSSARARRRLFRFGIVLAVAGAIGGVTVGLQSPKQPSSSPAKNAPPAQLVTRSTRVTAHERRAINATLSAFLGAALDRSSPATAWRLAGPEMKSGSTLGQWRAGTSPVPYFPTREKTFGGWEAVDAGPDYVVFDHLLVHPRRGSNTSSSIFAGEVIKRDGHWLVNRLYTIAVMKRPTKTGTHQVGPQDYAAPSASSQGGAGQSSGGSLGKQWLLVGAGIVGLALLFPFGFAIASALRSRRCQKQYTEHRNRELPPLPRSLQAGERR